MSHLHKFLAVILLGVFTAAEYVASRITALGRHAWCRARDLFDAYKAARNLELRDRLNAAALHYSAQVDDIQARRRALDAAALRALDDYEAATIDITAALEDLKEEDL